MAKEIALIDTEELKTISVPIRALDAYNFALNATCKEMDEGEVANFIATRILKAMGFVELK